MSSTAQQGGGQPLCGQLPGVEGLVQVVAVAADLDEQAAGGQVLIVKPVAEQHRAGEAGVHALHGPLPRRRNPQVLPPVRQLNGGAVVAPADDHHLGGLPPVYGAHRGHPGAVLGLDGVPVHIQHHLDAGVLRQILLHHGPAVGIAAGVAGVVVQSLVVQGVDARRVEGVGHHPAHRAHVDAAVGAAGPVAGGEPQPGRKAVVLGGVGVHHQHLRVGAVLFNGKGQRVFDLGGKVRRRLPGVVLDAARPAGNVLFAAALRVLLFDDRSRIRRAGVLRLQGHQIILNAAGQRLHGFRHRRGSGRACNL